LTIEIDDAGTGDILHGVVIGAYRPEDDVFLYDMIDVRYFQEPVYGEKRHLNEARRIALRLVDRLGLKEKEKISICTGDILNETAEALVEEYGEDRVERCRIENRAQYMVELAYMDELRNIGYEPIENRTEKWGKNFWHQYNWLRKDPKARLRWAKSAFPNLRRSPLFKSA